MKSAFFLRDLRAQGGWTLRWISFVILISNTGTIVFCAAVAWIVGDAIRDEPVTTLPWVVGLSGMLIRLAANLSRDRLAQHLSATIRMNLRNRLLKRAVDLGPHWLDQSGNAAWWGQQLLEQVDALHGYLSRYLPARQATMFVPLSMILLTLSVDWIAGLLLLMATPIIPIFMMLIGWGTESVHRSQQQQQASLAASLLDRLEALPWIRRMGGLPEAQRSVKDAAVAYRSVSMKVLRVAFLSSATLELFSALAIGLMAIYIGFALLGLVSFGPAPELTLAGGLFVLMLAPECFLPLRQLAQAHHDMNAAKASAFVLAPLLTDSHVQTMNQIMQPTRKDVAVELTDLSMKWPGVDQSLLHRLNLSVNRGDIIGIAGDSGQGKSTLIHLIAGFISPTAGTIKRDRHWAWLSQRPHLLHATLRENLQFACSHPVSDQTIETALAQVGLGLPNDMLPHGLETNIGELNQGISGGQAQRVGLCRAMLSGAKLWLLDEPTAALDEQTRDDLVNFLFSHARKSNVTILIASHDNTVLSRCDHIIRIQHASLQVEK